MFYPEGGIVKDPDLVGEPKRGVGALAIWSDAKILPVAIKGSGYLSNGVTINFGKPFFIEDIIPKDKFQNTEEDYVFAAGVIMNKVKDLYYGV